MEDDRDSYQLCKSPDLGIGQVGRESGIFGWANPESIRSAMWPVKPAAVKMHLMWFRTGSYDSAALGRRCTLSVPTRMSLPDSSLQR